MFWDKFQNLTLINRKQKLDEEVLLPLQSA